MKKLLSGEQDGSVASVWDQCATSYDVSRQNDSVYASCIKQTINRIPQGTMLCLEAGCGTGLSTFALQNRCSKIVAVDYSEESLKILDCRGLQNVTSVLSDLKSLPFEDSFFDASVCVNTLQHLKPNGPQQKAISELRRVTKQNGIICISVHHYSTGKRNAGWIKEGKPGQPGIDYIFRFTRGELLTLMPNASIKAVGYYGLLKIPLIGCKLQNLTALLFSGLASYLGYGHMLVASEINRK